jgi:hypothetical protein
LLAPYDNSDTMPYSSTLVTEPAVLEMVVHIGLGAFSRSDRVALYKRSGPRTLTS